MCLGTAGLAQSTWGSNFTRREPRGLRKQETPVGTEPGLTSEISVTVHGVGGRMREWAGGYILTLTERAFPTVLPQRPLKTTAAWPPGSHKEP